MLKKDRQVWKVVTGRDTRFVLDDDLKALENEEQIKSKEVLIMTGQLGNFTGDQLRSLGLAQLTAETRSDVEELYGMSPKSVFESHEISADPLPILIRSQCAVNMLKPESAIGEVKATSHAGRT